MKPTKSSNKTSAKSLAKKTAPEKKTGKKIVTITKPSTTAKRTTAVVKARPAKATAKPRQEITTEVIAARAYILWEKDGRPNGRDADYWFQAENQLKQETQSFAT